jgi:hypothetical protein
LLTCVPSCPTLSEPLDVLAITCHTIYGGRYSTAVTPSAQHIGVTPFPLPPTKSWGTAFPLYTTSYRCFACVIYKAEQNVCVINPQDSSVNPFAAGG